MLADLVDHVIGVDPDRDWITAAVLEARTSGVIDTARFPATRDGYRDVVAWADGHSQAAERAWVIEGTASYGRGLTVMLARGGEWVIEFDRAERKAAKDGAKSDALDAIRAGRKRWDEPSWPSPAPIRVCAKPSGSTVSPGPLLSGPAPLPSTSSKRWSSPPTTSCAGSCAGYPPPSSWRAAPPFAPPRTGPSTNAAPAPR